MKTYYVYYLLTKDSTLFYKEYAAPHTFREMRAYNKKLEKSLYNNIQCTGAYNDPAAFYRDYNTINETAIRL